MFSQQLVDIIFPGIIAKALEFIVKAVLFCGRQNLALRGHRDDNSSKSVKKRDA